MGLRLVGLMIYVWGGDGKEAVLVLMALREERDSRVWMPCFWFFLFGNVDYDKFLEAEQWGCRK